MVDIKLALTKKKAGDSPAFYKVKLRSNVIYGF